MPQSKRRSEQRKEEKRAAARASRARRASRYRAHYQCPRCGNTFVLRHTDDWVSCYACQPPTHPPTKGGFVVCELIEEDK